MTIMKTMRLTLVRASNDEASFSPGYQAELRSFYSLARAEIGKITAVTFMTNDADVGAGLVGEFLMPSTPMAGPLLATAISGWLQGRTGRALRLTVDDVVVEATSAAELYGLFNLMTAVTEPHKRFASDSV